MGSGGEVGEMVMIGVHPLGEAGVPRLCVMKGIDPGMSSSERLAI